MLLFANSGSAGHRGRPRLAGETGAYNADVNWLVDGYNVIRRSPELAGREAESLEAGRTALCRWLSEAARASGDRFTVVFDGARAGGATSGAAGVAVVFSSARETADSVLARMAAQGGAVVSNDREVQRAAARAGAIAVAADPFLSRLEAARRASRAAASSAVDPGEDDVGNEASGQEPEEDDPPRGPRKGNPRRLPKRRRAAARALGRLDRSSR
jgi:uncharacterized protein